MLRNLEEMMGYHLCATDGQIGRCKDFLFDEDFWTIRYMVADTGRWLPGRLVLISPISMAQPDRKSQEFPVRLTKQQIEESPHISEDAPVSRRHEMSYHRFFGWPFYWAGHAAWGWSATPQALYTETQLEIAEDAMDAENSRLRSVDEVRGYAIDTTDDDIGSVHDVIVDDETWKIRYLVIDTRKWLPGKKVLLAPEWVDAIDWADQRVTVPVNKATIESCPEYDPHAPINREYETRLYDFHGRPKYWERDAVDAHR